MSLDLNYEWINGDLKSSAIGECRSNASEVEKFYAYKTLLVTGATGFLGRCLVEKLLRSCPKLSRVYILMREKDGLSVDERLKMYIQHEVFDNLRKINPNFHEKITAIKGDLAASDLDLSAQDRTIISSTTNLIFHSGFFDNPNILAGDIVRTNILGTRTVLDLAAACLHLEAFVLVSSVLTHNYWSYLREKFYPMTENSIVDDILHAEQSQTSLSDMKIRELTGDHHDLASFSRAMAEEALRLKAKDFNFPCGVFRSGYIMSSYREPLSGWIGGKNEISKMWLDDNRTAFFQKLPLDFVPCDLTANALLVIVPNLIAQWSVERQPVVYNYSSILNNPITFRDICIRMKNADDKLTWLNFLTITDNVFLYLFLYFLLNFIPALVNDVYRLFSGNKPQILAPVLQEIKNMDKHFRLGNRISKVYIPNMIGVMDQLSSIDKELFFCDIRKLDWKDYASTMWKGVDCYKNKGIAKVIRNG